VLRSTGDTLRGEVENGFWNEPPAFVRFRPTAGSASQLLQPQQVRAFGLTGGRYFRFEVLPIDHAAETRLALLPQGNAHNVQQDSLLAEVLLEGPVTLLRVARPAVLHLLLLSPHRPVLDLSERLYLRQRPNLAWAVTDGNNYRGELGLYFQGCPEAFTAIQTAPFTAEGLAAVVSTYNRSCSPSRQAGRSWLSQAKPRRWLSLQGGVLAGMRFNRIGSLSDYYAGTCTDCRPHPFGGLYAELFQPSRTMAIYGELSLSSFRSQGARLDYYTPAGAPSYQTYDYQGGLFTSRLGLRFFSPLPHERQWLFGLGYELNWILNPTITAQSGSPATLTQEELVYAMPTLLPNLSVGWRSRRLTLSLDGQMYIGSGINNFFGAFINSNFALRSSLAYRLGRNPDLAPPPQP
jgi:hypothetical protein